MLARRCRSVKVVSGKSEFELFAMIYLLYLVAAVACNAARIPRTAEHPHFPNLRSVYHGHGATSYQNVQIDNHDSVPLPKNHHSDSLHLGTEYHGRYDGSFTPIIEENEQANHLEVPEKISFEVLAADQVHLPGNQYYGHSDLEHGYDYHL